MEILSEVLEAIEEVRNLSLPGGVTLEVVTEEWVEENWGRPQVESAGRELEVQEEIYKALFLLPEDASFREIKERQASSVMAAVVGKKVYVVREYFDPFDKPRAMETLAHEVTHILQATHFKAPSPGTHDEQKAWFSLIEGDAMLTGKEFVERSGFAEIPPKEVQLRNITDPLTEIWLFPYDYGEAFVRDLFGKGGWLTVDLAYENIPTTTEQVVHPEIYVRGEGPNIVDALPAPDPGWELAISDRMGEHFAMVVMGTWLPIERASGAAEGWGGDNLTIYFQGDEYLLTWRIDWDGEEDVGEFYSSFLEMMGAVGAEQTEAGVWKLGDRYVTILMGGRTIDILSSDDLAILQEVRESVRS